MKRAVARQIEKVPALRPVRAVLVSVNGKTVLNLYNDSNAAESEDVWSVTKSVVSILIGIAIDEGHLKLDQTLADLLPKHAPNMSPDVAAVTLHQLLTMTAGFPGDGGDGFTLSADDVTETILRLGLINEPGATFGYSNSGAHIVTAVLANATGRSVLDYAREKLFDPLGIKSRPAYEGFDAGEPKSDFDKPGFAWAADRQGVNTGCCLLKLTAPDMIKIGELYLNQGDWHGRRIVSEDWVRTSTKVHVTGEDAEPGAGYGYFWWLFNTAEEQPIVAAQGAFGQFIVIAPEHRLVIAVSTRDTGDPDISSVGRIIDAIISPFEQSR